MLPGKLQSKAGVLKRIITNNLVSKGIFSKQSDNDFTILMYHGIDRRQDTTFNQRFFKTSSFEKQLIEFKKHLNILSWADFLNHNYSKEKPNVLLTFDDGYANNFNYALPLLDKHNVHAFFFITGLGIEKPGILWADAVDIVCRLGKEGSIVSLGGYSFALKDHQFLDMSSSLSLPAYLRSSSKKGIDEKRELQEQLLSIYNFTKNKELDDYWQLMTDEQIRRASESKNITIGSHGFYHNNLGSLSTADAVAEVELSRNYLENLTQKQINTIAFPDGSYTQQLNDELHKAGFIKQFLVNYNFDDAGKRPFVYDRMGLYPYMGNSHEILFKILRQ